MKNKFLQYLFLSCSVAVLFSACRKDPFNGKETGESGKTYVWITEADGDPYLQHFQAFSDIKTVVLFTVRRDAANKADLQKAITVTLTADPDSTDNSGLTPFTADLYSFPSSADLAAGGVYAGNEGISVNGDGTVITIKFAPGEFAKSIIYKVDGSKLDLSNTYGAVYKITNLGGFSGKAGYSVVAAGIAVKNQYDGDYTSVGSIKFPPGGTDRSWDALDKECVTVNANTVQTAVGDLGPNGYYMNLTVNADNTVSIAPAGAAPASLQATGPCTYDPATKSFDLTFKYVGGTGDRRLQEVITKN